jgi:hypothetical protein
MNTRILAAVLVGCMAMYAAPEALAWGPQAQKDITSTGIKHIRRSVSQAFRVDLHSGYEADVLRGASSGIVALGDNVSIGTKEQAIHTIGNEMVLLREMRNHGAGSYFAYRMGALSAVVSEAIMPFSFDSSPESIALLRSIDMDIEANLGKLRTYSDPLDVQSIRMIRDYFKKRNVNFGDAEDFISSDYRLGRGFDGYLSQAAPSFFAESVRAVTDVWYTIFVTDSGKDTFVPSEISVAWYLVAEIEYQLRFRRNLDEAERAYRTFERLDLGLQAAHVKIGDLLYAFGAHDRGVQEWQRALEFSGPERVAVSRKLSNHYLVTGKEAFNASRTPETADQALIDAETAFRSALEADSSNVDAERLLSETRTAIRDREQQRELVINLLAAADKLAREAGGNEVKGYPSEAIAAYRRAEDLYRNQAVEDFPTLKTAAAKGSQDMNQKVEDLINSLKERAEQAIEQGDTLVDTNKYDEAMESYRSVGAFLNPIPEDDADHGADRTRITLLAQQQLEVAELEKTRWEERQEEAGQAGGAQQPARPARRDRS